jgi:lysophospholipid acyltransferase (LPLAT)-like uncharacterized protein
VLAASRTGYPIIPAGAAAVRSWTFNSWDRFAVPKPGSIVFLAYGDPIIVPADLGETSVADWQARVTLAQDAVTAACDEAAASEGSRRR